MSPKARNAIQELMEAIDAFIPLPTREVDKPFLMCIEDVFNIEGRGTVVTGRVERGVLKRMEEVEIVGLKDTAQDGGDGHRNVPQAARLGAMRATTSACCCAAPRRTKWNAAWCWPSPARSRRTRSSRRKFMCCRRMKVAVTRRSSPTTVRNSISAPRTSPAR